MAVVDDEADELDVDSDFADDDPDVAGFEVSDFDESDPAFEPDSDFEVSDFDESDVDESDFAPSDDDSEDEPDEPDRLSLR